tara:strand:- start:63 stop:299 length:237 start_codon:yes stop_codon:yes gene_type:complete
MSNDKQQTAVEYLVEQLFPKALSAEQYYHIEQAKAMHKEEKIKFATDFFFWWYNQTSGTNTVEAVEKYYNETFGGNNE